MNLCYNDFEKSVNAEAVHMLEPRDWSSMLQLLSLANVLGFPVYSGYPEVNLASRPLLNCKTLPSTGSLKKPVFYVMWTRDRNQDSRPGALFQPSHFCMMSQESFENNKHNAITVTTENEENESFIPANTSVIS